MVGNFILSGSIQGTVVIYNNKKNLWKKKSQINDHLNMPITSLFFNDNLNDPHGVLSTLYQDIAPEVFANCELCKEVSYCTDVNI